MWPIIEKYFYIHPFLVYLPKIVPKNGREKTFFYVFKKATMNGIDKKIFLFFISLFHFSFIFVLFLLSISFFSTSYNCHIVTIKYTTTITTILSRDRLLLFSLFILNIFSYTLFQWETVILSRHEWWK